MKIFTTLVISFLFNANLFAQANIKVVKQPKINPAIKATTNATAKAKIHANSNTVFRGSKSQPANKKNPSKKEVKDDLEIKNSKAKKQKK